MIESNIVTHRCRECGREKPDADFYRVRGRKGVGTKPMTRCIPCYCLLAKRAHKTRMANNPAYREKMSRSAWAASLKRIYGLSEVEYTEMLGKQGGACAICRRPQSDSPSNKKPRLAVDHDHESGRVRGLLCTRCNTLVGVIEKESGTLAKCAEYLAASSKESK